LWEALIVNTECRVIVARSGDVKVELAVFPIDVPTACQALESGSAGTLAVRSQTSGP
jgi:hypothetical protein